MLSLPSIKERIPLVRFRCRIDFRAESEEPMPQQLLPIENRAKGTAAKESYY